MLIKYCQTIQGPHLEETAFRREMISQINTVWWLVKSTKVQTMFWQLVKKNCTTTNCIASREMNYQSNTTWYMCKYSLNWRTEDEDNEMCKYLLNWRTEDDDNEMNWRAACPWWNKCTLSLKLVELWTYPGRQVTHRRERSSALSRIKH